MIPLKAIHHNLRPTHYPSQHILIYTNLNHHTVIENFIAVGLVGFVLTVLGIVLTPEKLQKLSAKLFTVNVFAALVTIVIANAMGWVDTEKKIGKMGNFLV